MTKCTIKELLDLAKDIEKAEALEFVEKGGEHISGTNHLHNPFKQWIVDALKHYAESKRKKKS